MPPLALGGHFMIKAILTAALFSVLALGGNARADTLFDFTAVTEFLDFASGQFTVLAPNQNYTSVVTSASGGVTLQGSNSYSITGVSGYINYSPYIGFVPYDITFTFAQGSIEFDHPAGSPHDFFTLFDASGDAIRGGYAVLSSPALVSPVPLPASAPLLGLALLILAAFGFASNGLKREPCGPALIVG
jgi:hypothetical protein